MRTPPLPEALRARRPAVLAGAGVLGALVIAYVGVAAWGADRVPGGTTVAGVQVGGLPADAATARLERESRTLAARPVTVSAGGRTARLDAAKAGLSLDAAATVDRLTGFSVSPAAVWHHLVGGGAADPVVRADDARLRTALRGAAARLDRPAREGAVTFAGGRPAVTAPRPGAVVDVEKAGAAVRRSWPSTRPIALPVRTSQPNVSAAALDRARREFAEPALSGPLTLLVAGRTVRLTPEQVAPALSVVPDGKGGLRPTVDGTELAAGVESQVKELQREPVDARIVLAGGRPEVVPSQDGTRLDPAALARAVLPALTSPQRTARVALVPAAPRLTTAGAQALGVTEPVSTFTTYFPVNPPRTANIRLAAHTIDGTLLKPGEVFSLNGALGQRTGAKGYQQAPVINGGRLEKDFGGGVSQVSTTLFNAVFFAGLEVLEHKPHSFYISRYPEGREATVSWPDVDNRFRNDSGHGILIDTSVTGNAITVTFWGTKVWDVKAEKGPRFNVKQPKDVYDDDGTCVAQSPNQGFDVVVKRLFYSGGALKRTQAFRTRYIPEDHVVCGPKPGAPTPTRTMTTPPPAN